MVEQVETKHKQKEHEMVHGSAHGTKQEESAGIPKLWIILGVALIALVLFNQYQVSTWGAQSVQAAVQTRTSSSPSTRAVGASSSVDELVGIVISQGVPDIYGEELGVSYDDPVQSLSILAQLDPSLPSGVKFENDAQKKRYVVLGSAIACEFCCGAKTLVFSNGQPACGCQHSYAMRGLAAHLIKTHPDMSDAEMLRELARWKSLFFPKQMIQKFASQITAKQFTPDIEALALGIDIEGIDKSDLTDLDQLPGMVGGC